jgi:Kef-type K+ transport system membrane component KefB
MTIKLNEGDKSEASDAIARFVLSFFAPIYLVSMGLNANFITGFDLS